MLTSPSQVPESRDSTASKPADQAGAWLSETELDALAALDPLAILETTDRAIEDAMSMESRAPEPISWGSDPTPSPEPSRQPTEMQAEDPFEVPREEFQETFSQPQAVQTSEPSPRTPPAPDQEALNGDWAVVYLPWRRNPAPGAEQALPPAPTPVEPARVEPARVEPTLRAQVPPEPMPQAPSPIAEALAATATRPDPERSPELAEWPAHGQPHPMPEPLAAQRDAQLLVARRMVLPLGMAEHAQVRVEVWSNPAEPTPRYRASITIDELPVRGAGSLDEALLSVREWLFDRLSGQQPVWRRRDGR